MEAKLDKLLLSLRDLKNSNNQPTQEMSDKITANLCEMTEKMNKLERNVCVCVGQDVAADVAKKLK